MTKLSCILLPFTNGIIEASQPIWPSSWDQFEGGQSLAVGKKIVKWNNLPNQLEIGLLILDGNPCHNPTATYKNLNPTCSAYFAFLHLIEIFNRKGFKNDIISTRFDIPVGDITIMTSLQLLMTQVDQPDITEEAANI
ncbi:hypothetical protein ACJX0J_014783, partial [Zea mays]